jgi:Aspartyl/Asparaginyl beta-hydroxylase
MLDRIRLNLIFDPERLKKDLQKLEESVWIEHFVKQNFSGNWSIIPLRACAGTTHPIQMISYQPDCKEYVNTEYLETCDYFKEVLSNFKCYLQNVRLMKLSAGSEIKEHSDLDLDFESGKARLHIPIKTNNKVKFYLNDNRVKMNEGECWYLRLSNPHRVINSSKEDRVHLVIDALVNDWLKDLFEKSEYL